MEKRDKLQDLIVKYDPEKNVVQLKDPNGTIDKIPLDDMQDLVNSILLLTSDAWAESAVRTFQEHQNREAHNWRTVSLIEAAIILILCIMGVF